MMDATRIPLVTQASQPSEDEEDQCQADSQPSLPPAPPNPVTVPRLVASSKPRNIRENNSKHLVQSGLFGMRVIPSNKMITVTEGQFPPHAMTGTTFSLKYSKHNTCNEHHKKNEYLILFNNSMEIFLSPPSPRHTIDDKSFTLDRTVQYIHQQGKK